VARPARRNDEDFAAEVEAHLAIEIDRLIAEGRTPDEARREARRAFGNVARARETFRESRRWRLGDVLMQDLRAAVRALWRYPATTMVAVLSLAAGIGATAATLTIRDAVFRNPPPLYAHPEQLARIRVQRADQPVVRLGRDVPGGVYAAWRDRFGSAIAASTSPRAHELRVDDRVETIAVRDVTSVFLDVLGVAPARGRLPAAGTDDVLVSHRVWQHVFGGRIDVVGQPVAIDGKLATVTGVAPDRFWFVDTGTAAWRVVDEDAAAAASDLQVVVRRPEGQTMTSLQRELESGLSDYTKRLGAAAPRLSVAVSDIGGTPLADQVSIVLPYVLAIAVLLTLLIACANVAVLMIAQWSGREREIAIRAALGASRGRLIRALLAESSLLAISGGGLGLGATYALLKLFVSRAGGDARMFDLTMHPTAIAQVALIAIAAAIAVGLAPALYETRRLQHNPLVTLRTSDRVRQRWRHALVGFEIAITIALLVVTGSMVGSFFRATAAERGYVRDPLLTVHVENAAGVVPQRALDVIRGVAGVQAAAVSTAVPYAGSPTAAYVGLDESSHVTAAVDRIAASPTFFDTLGVRITRGRAFDAADDRSSVAIVSERFSREWPGGRDPVGQRVWLDGHALDIVGVVADYDQQVFQPIRNVPKLFTVMPERDVVRAGVDALVRVAGDPATYVEQIRQTFRTHHEDVITRVTPLSQIVTISGQEMLAGTAPLVPLVTMGLLLSAAGIYGVLAFAIQRRARELAIRLAIGATPGRVAALIVRQAMWLAGIGCACGVGLTFAVSRVVRAAGGGGSFLDPPWPAFLVPVVVIGAVALVATCVPIRRTLKIQPSTVLRQS
jgi:predicted permease